MKPPTSVAHSSTRSYVYQDDGKSELVMHTYSHAPKFLPMLSSHCPGWVCYAEKTQPESLSYLSEVKSAQQIIGCLLKCVFPASASISTTLNLSSMMPFFIVSVQPCFDKKLEASRKDFYDENSSYNEVDLVLSTQEIFDLINSQISQLAETCSLEEYFIRLAFDSAPGADGFESIFRSYSPGGWELVQSVDRNAGSGGYAEHIFKFAAQEILGLDLWSTELEYKVSLSCYLNSSVSILQEGRNADIATVSASVEGRGTLKFGRAYGFQNIQSIMLKLKRGQCDLDFVEVYSCLSGEMYDL